MNIQGSLIKPSVFLNLSSDISSNQKVYHHDWLSDYSKRFENHFKKVQILLKKLQVVEEKIGSLEREIDEADFKEWSSLQEDISKLMEDMSSAIVQLLEILPPGYNVSGIIAQRNQIITEKFIKYEKETRQAFFKDLDGNILIVDSKHLFALTFPPI